MTRPVLPNDLARRLFLDRHALSTPPSGPATGQGLLDLIEQLGFVQLDSVNTMARAHDLILWSRRQSYRPASLRWLNDRARGTFEHWTHDASKIPMVFYPYWRLRFARDRARLQARWTDWHGPAFRGELDRVLDHVAAHGPVSSAEMSGERAAKSTGWWDWHPSKTALEFLWRTGALAVTRRDGFRKVYDLSERVIPAEILASEPGEAETVDWACRSALDRLGFATSGELAAFWDLVRPDEAKAWVADRLRNGDLVEADLTCTGGASRRVVLRSGTLEGLADLPEPPRRMRVLSPFDPALRDRARAERLFGFRFRIEIFVPEPRRVFGYYVFPLMEGDRLIGRVDMSADRASAVLRVRALWPEPGVRWGKGRQARLEAELDRVLHLACCDKVTFEDGWLREAGGVG